MSKQIAKSELSPQIIAAARRIRDRLGFAGKGKRGMYLCHTFCEVGATPLAPVLEQIKSFLVANPDEVLVIVNEDYVTPADFVKAVNDAGLGKLMFTPPARGKWPTLRRMIDRNERLMILAENKAGAAPWYQPAFKRLVKDTPYTFDKNSDLTSTGNLAKSCQANRGSSRAPLLLINHWTSFDPVPKPSDASIVNARGPLLRRARACERLRGQLPNLVAVNFYRRGDLFGVVDSLNGVK